MTISAWFIANRTAPDLGSPEIRKRLTAARDAGETFIRATFRRDCVFCGRRLGMVQDGLLSTGLPLEHYTPEFEEVLKNHVMECGFCFESQYS